ncbi:MAG TPA: hypothetical protein VGI39_25190 [Polyangiaceae bacterium]|jgi:hypothetical protein
MRRSRSFALLLLLLPACGALAPSTAPTEQDPNDGAPGDGTAPAPDAGSALPEAGLRTGDAADDASHTVDATIDSALPPSAEAGSDAVAPPDAPEGEAGADAGADAGFDASLPSVEAGSDADAPLDAGLPDAYDSDPIAHCQTGMRDVFYVNVAGYPGPFGLGPQTMTNLDSNWTLGTSYPSSYSFTARQAGGPENTLAVGLPDGGMLAPGTYSLGGTSGAPFDLALDSEGCSLASGTMTVLDAESDGTDAGVTLPSSILLSYDIQCEGAESTIPVEGCLRYALSPPLEPMVDAGSEDAGPLAPCASGGNVFYVDPKGGYAGLDGPVSITGATGTWSAGASPLLQLRVFDTNLAPWQIAGQLTSFGPGTYVSTGDDHFAPWLNIQVNGATCSSMPTGTFTVTTVESNGDEISKLLMSFDLACADAGTLRGCASYGN